MSEHTPQTDSEGLAKSVAAGYEITDVNPHNLLVFAVALFLSILVVIGISGLLYELMRTHQDRASDEAQKNELAGGSAIAPLGPPLQPSQADPQMDWQEWDKMKGDNLHIATTLTDKPIYMNDEKILPHMPVEWAIRYYVKNGIPQNTATDVPVPVGTAKSGPTEYSPAYSSDGR